jgi:hypothetical protein
MAGELAAPRPVPSPCDSGGWWWERIGVPIGFPTLAKRRPSQPANRNNTWATIGFRRGERNGSRSCCRLPFFPNAGNRRHAAGGTSSSARLPSVVITPFLPTRRSHTRRYPRDQVLVYAASGNGPFHGLYAMSCRRINLGSAFGTLLALTEDLILSTSGLDGRIGPPPPAACSACTSCARGQHSSADAEPFELTTTSLVGGDLTDNSSSELTSSANNAQKQEPLPTSTKLEIKSDDERTLEPARLSLISGEPSPPAAAVAPSSSSESAKTTPLTFAFPPPLCIVARGRGARVKRCPAASRATLPHRRMAPQRGPPRSHSSPFICPPAPSGLPWDNTR